MQLDFNVEEQTLTWVNKEKTPVADSVRYLTARFKFSDEWTGINKTATFFTSDGKPYNQLLVDDGCEVPHEVIKAPLFKVSVAGGDLITTNIIIVGVIKSGYVKGETPKEPTPDVYAQILEKVEHTEQIAKAMIEGEIKRNDAEIQRANNEEERVDSEKNRVINEEKRMIAEAQREQLKDEMETLKDDTEDAMKEVEGLSTTMKQELTMFQQNGGNTLDDFSNRSGASLENFINDGNRAISEFNDKAEVELEKAKVATNKANEATERANKTIDNMNNTFANALKGYESGAYVVVNDVSPLEHRLNVKLTSDTITDFSDVKVTRYGKNLFDKTKEGIGKRTYTSDGKTVERYGYEITLPIGKYTISVFPLENPPSTTGNQLGFRVVDTNNLQQNGNHFIYNSEHRTPVTIEIKQGYKLLLVKLTSDSGVDNVWNSFQKYNIQLEAGEHGSEFEECKLQTHTANADGTVDGVASFYPTTTLLTDNSNITINTQYNKDINKVVAELQQAIISLGGNI